jgi:hypothetical protein
MSFRKNAAARVERAFWQLKAHHAPRAPRAGSLAARVELPEYEPVTSVVTNQCWQLFLFILVVAKSGNTKKIGIGIFSQRCSSASLLLAVPMSIALV